MRVTPPVDITALKLVSSTAAEPHAPAAYSAATTYGYGAIVSVAADYAIYESLQAGNTGNTPKTSPLWWQKIGHTETPYNAAKTNYALDETCSFDNRVYKSLVAQTAANPLPVPPETETSYWIYVGPTNKFAMFDLFTNTQTVAASPLTVVIRPGMRINTVGLTGMEANEVSIVATSAFAGGQVYSRTIDLNTREVLDGYDYAFEPFSTSPSAVVFDIPPFSDIELTITLTRTSGNVKCGAVVVGTYIYLGATQLGATNAGLNFSDINRDKYGTATLVPRRTLPQTKQRLVVDAARVNKVKAARVLLNARPALYTGIDDSSNAFFDMLTILGIYTQFEIGAVYNSEAEITLALEEI